MEKEEEGEQNSSTKFARSIVEQVNRSDIEAMVLVQRDMLSRYEKTNEMLINFNLLSLSRFEATSQEFKQHTQVLYDMKKDLDSIFRRIRQLKQKLGTMYPEAFSFCSDVYNVMSDEEDETVGHKKVKGKNVKKRSNDHDSIAVKDSMNDMLETHQINMAEQNGGVIGNITQNSGTDRGSMKSRSNSDEKDKVIMNNADTKQLKSECLGDTCSKDNIKENSVVENG